MFTSSCDCCRKVASSLAVHLLSKGEEGRHPVDSGIPQPGRRLNESLLLSRHQYYTHDVYYFEGTLGFTLRLARERDDTDETRHVMIIKGIENIGIGEKDEYAPAGSRGKGAIERSNRGGSGEECQNEKAYGTTDPIG